jgi:hypothetical protein
VLVRISKKAIMAEQWWKKYRAQFAVHTKHFFNAFFIFTILLTNADGRTDENRFQLEQYYPIASELSWEYIVEENSRHFSQYVKCVKKSDTQFVLCTTSKRHSQYFFYIDSTIIKLSHVKLQLPCIPISFTIHVEPNLPVFDLAGHIGDIWNWEGQFVSLICRKKAVVKTEIRGIQKIKNQNQDINCLEIATAVSIDGRVDSLVAFYSNGIGLVKQISNHQKKELIKLCRNDKEYEVAISPQSCDADLDQEDIEFSLQRWHDLLKVLSSASSAIHK